MYVQKWVSLKSISSLILILLMVSLIQADGESALTTRGENTGRTVSARDASPATRASIVLSQSNSEDLVDGKSISCTITESRITRDTSFYRVFKLSDFDVAEPLVAQEVRLGVEASIPGFGSTTQPVTVKLHTLDGDLALANLTTIYSATYQIPALALETIKFPVNAVFNADQTLVLEIAIPDAVENNTGHKFYPGANTQGATGPSYIFGPDCGVNIPTDISTLNLGVGVVPPDWVMSVSGETQSGNAYQLLPNGDFEYDINGDKLPETWSAKRLTGDKMKKNKEGKVSAYSGNWAFVFKGKPGEKSQIAHPVDLKPRNTAADDTLSFSAAVRGKNLTQGGVIKMNVTYKGDAKPQGKVKLVIPPGTYEYQVLNSDILTLVKSADKVKLIIQNKATAGRFLIDDVKLVWEKSAAALPLPAASGN